MIEEYLEDKSIYWNDDIEIVETFALKTIKKFEEKKGSKQALLPMFKDLEDKAFAIKLFRQSLLKGKEYRERHRQTYEELGNRTYRQYGLDHHASRLSRDFIVPDHSHQRYLK